MADEMDFPTTEQASAAIQTLLDYLTGSAEDANTRTVVKSCCVVGFYAAGQMTAEDDTPTPVGDKKPSRIAVPVSKEGKAKLLREVKEKLDAPQDVKAGWDDVPWALIVDMVYQILKQLIK